jgi:flavodoxin
MNILIVYKSLSGFTEKYAKWIAEDLHTTAVELDSFTPSVLNKDTVVV